MLRSALRVARASQQQRARVLPRWLASTPKPPAGEGVGKGTAPENFYDEDVEAEKEFLDITTALYTEKSQQPLSNLTRIKGAMSREQIEKLGDPIPGLDMQSIIAEASEAVHEADDFSLEQSSNAKSSQFMATSGNAIKQAVAHPDLGDHLEKFKNMYVPEEYVNYTIPWKDTEGIEDPLLEKFVPNAAPERFTYGSQGARACTGKLQRRGKEGKLGCHLIDLDGLSPLDVVNLRRFLSDDAEIMGKRHTGLCSKCQRKVAKTIKTSRQLGMLPHIGQYMVEDSRPSHVDKPFHDVVKGATRVESKTIF